MVALSKKINNKQSGNVDCCLFATAYAVDIWNGIDPSTIIYDQLRMREHLTECFEKQKITKFPRYRIDPSCAKPVDSHEDSEWKLPKKRAKRSTHGKRKCITSFY